MIVPVEGEKKMGNMGGDAQVKVSTKYQRSVYGTYLPIPSFVTQRRPCRGLHLASTMLVGYLCSIPLPDWYNDGTVYSPISAGCDVILSGRSTRTYYVVVLNVSAPQPRPLLSRLAPDGGQSDPTEPCWN